MYWKRGKAPTPTLSILLRKRPVLLRADVVLTKDAKWPYEGQFCGKIDRERSCSKASFVRTKSALSKMGRFPSKTESVGVGAFSPVPNVALKLANINARGAAGLHCSSETSNSASASVIETQLL